MYQILLKIEHVGGVCRYVFTGIMKQKYTLSALRRHRDRPKPFGLEGGWKSFGRAGTCSRVHILTEGSRVHRLD